jgi:hypothetical protein
MHRLVTPLYLDHTEETCEGLRIYPAGQLAYVQGGVQTAKPVWFSIESAPQGANFDKVGVPSGSPLLLKASGTYVIRMSNEQHPNTSSYCTMDTIHVIYEKKPPLSLDLNAISAYVCSDNTKGYIRVKGINGMGSYTYQLRSQGGGTLIETNTTGEFTHGSAGQTYTVRVIDACGTQFDQDVTIRNLSDVRITYSSGGVGRDVFCEGQTLQVNCITLNATSYSWTGPDGWTSMQQNPTRPQATPAMSGLYTVTATLEAGCGAKTESIHITVSPCVVPVNPHLRSRVIQ